LQRQIARRLQCETGAGVARLRQRFEPRREYREAEVNDLLREWLSTFVAPFGFDHVTLRRRLVDTGLLLRDAAGSAYWTLRRVPGMDLDPARVLAQIREERAPQQVRG